jgi:RNA polymerase sigma factor (TIGR02999 family)
MNNENNRPAGKVTQLLLRWSAGDEAALTALLPLVYEELRSLARRHLRHERSSHTLQRTALVHEAFLRIVDQKQVGWESRTQFYGIASQMMRRVLVDYARRRSAAKRGDGAQHVDLAAIVEDESEDAPRFAQEPAIDFAAIDEALKRLEALDPQQGRLVELRFFGGLSIKETADVIGVSPATVKREWAIARAWLQREITTGEGA